ncbi:hypothetical protein SI65_02694 [Aspergillus cristatus]|uniref:Uncharacterized protein n=1 Tax=Aspergillus cristatus TaxID=573508 RepID=A0A1E3BLL5_ASPCR|nr:hypothetical protein SI65_02694 [Aspergillus cristatus]
MIGKTDYSVWYGSPQNAETNLAVVDTESYSTYFAEPQLIGYMILVHAARKKADERDASAYGIATNGEDWKFYCVDHNTKVSWISLGWHMKKKKIVLLLDRILKQLATLSSTLTRQLTVSQATGTTFQTVDDMDLGPDGDREENV